MTKWHIKEDGTPGICKAEVQPCPLGGDDSHFDSYESAEKRAQELLEAEYMRKDKEEYTEEDAIEKAKKSVKIKALHPLLTGGHSPVRYGPKDLMVLLRIEKQMKKANDRIESAKRYNINKEWELASQTGEYKSRDKFEKWYEHNNPYYLSALSAKKTFRKAYTKILKQRFQAMEIQNDLNDIIIDSNYSVSSAGSASSYFVIKSEHKEKALEYFNRKGFGVEEKTNKTNEDLLIRVCDHKNYNNDEDISVKFRRTTADISNTKFEQLVKRFKNS